MSGGLESGAAVSRPGLRSQERSDRFGRRRLAYLKDVTVHLVRRELAIRYRGTVLGWVWALVPVLLQLAVTQFLFTRVIPLNVPNFPIFLLIGVLAWNAFASGLQMATSSLEMNRSFVLRPGFPTALLPVVAMLVVFVDYLVALPILFIALLLTTGVPLTALLLPVLILIQLVLIAGLGLLLAPLQLHFKDVRQLVAIVVALGFWLTPVFYRQRSVPGAFEPLYKINPMAHLLEAQRQILLEGTVPSLLAVSLVALSAIALLGVGSAVFAATRHSLPERI
jgi:lipopolysaccharide transport system permease protein